MSQTCRQWYTDDRRNLRVEGGALVLQAEYDEGAATANPPRKPFTSGRVRSYLKMGIKPSWRYPTVRIEARIKLPRGLGLWPALW